MDIEDILEEKYNNDLELTLEESKYVLENDKHKNYADSLLEKAYETVLSELEKKDKRISDLEFALMDMVLQFADENKYSINTMGLSALEIAFGELNFDNPMPIKEIHKRYKKLEQEYYKVEREGK